MNSITVLVAEDHPSVREGLLALLNMEVNISMPLLINGMEATLQANVLCQRIVSTNCKCASHALTRPWQG